MRAKTYLSFFLITFIAPNLSFAGNHSIESFNKAKKLLMNKVYHDHKETLYCSASFDSKKNIKPPAGFTSEKYKKRAKKLEFEHVVAAQSFGQTFPEWRDGHESCVSNKGKPFKGRNCASKMNTEYRLMQADLYNLFPAIGSVNAMRSNYSFQILPPDTPSSFGSCKMKIANRKAEPPESARGRIARTYFYMQDAYPRYRMSKQQLQLMRAWNKQYPVSAWECERYNRIKGIQGSENQIMKSVCSK